MASSFGFLAEQHPKYQEVCLQLENRKPGRLYQAINLFVGDRVKAQEVCNYFQINDSAKIEDDFTIIYDNLFQKFNIFAKWDLLGIIPKTTEKFYSHLEEKSQVEVIAIAAFILVSGFAFIKWKSVNEPKPESSSEQLSQSTALYHPVKASICLGIPASAVSGLTQGTVIERREIIRLIDAASNFLCIKTEDAEKLSVDIDPEQVPSSDSQSKFYIRVDIPNGRDIVRQETKHIIKRDLPPYTTGQIAEIGRITSVNSISSFHRV